MIQNPDEKEKVKIVKTSDKQKNIFSSHSVNKKGSHKMTGKKINGPKLHGWRIAHEKEIQMLYLTHNKRCKLKTLKYHFLN